MKHNQSTFQPEEVQPPNVQPGQPSLQGLDPLDQIGQGEKRVGLDVADQNLGVVLADQRDVAGGLLDRIVVRLVDLLAAQHSGSSMATA